MLRRNKRRASEIPFRLLERFDSRFVRSLYSSAFYRSWKVKKVWLADVLVNDCFQFAPSINQFCVEYYWYIFSWLCEKLRWNSQPESISIANRGPLNLCNRFHNSFFLRNLWLMVLFINFEFFAISSFGDVQDCLNAKLCDSSKAFHGSWWDNHPFTPPSLAQTFHVNAPMNGSGKLSWGFRENNWLIRDCARAIWTLTCDRYCAMMKYWKSYKCFAATLNRSMQHDLCSTDRFRKTFTLAPWTKQLNCARLLDHHL